MHCPMDAFIPGNIFHIYNHAIGKENLFKEDADYILLLRIFKRIIKKHRITIIAYCLMPNHYHFLLRQDEEYPLYRIFNTLFSTYVQIINKKYHRKGRLLESPLKHILVNSDPYLIYLCQYIHYNPVKAGLVSNAADWIFSNYREWIGLRNGTLFYPKIRDEYFESPAEYAKCLNEHEKYLEDMPFMRLLFRLQDATTATSIRVQTHLE